MNIDEIREQLPMITAAIFAVGALFLLISLRFFRRSRKHPYWTQRRKAGQRGLQVFLLSAAIFTIGAIACSLSLIFSLADSDDEENAPVVIRETVLVTAETLSTSILPARTPQDQFTQTLTIEETIDREDTPEEMTVATNETVEDDAATTAAFTPEATDSNIEDTPTLTRTATASATQTTTLTVTPLPSATDTIQPSPTSEETDISDDTADQLDTATTEPSPTPTQTASLTATTEPSVTPSSTHTQTETPTATFTPSPTLTLTYTHTPTLTSTPTPSPSPTMAQPTLVSPFQTGRLALATAMPDEDTTLNIIQITDEYPSPLDTASRQRLPAGTQRIYFVVRYEEMKTGLPWRRVLLRDGQLIVSRTSLWGVPTNGRAIFFFGNSEGFPAGRYEIQLFLGEDNEFATSETIILSE